MSRWQRYLSAFCVAFFSVVCCCSLGWSQQRSILGIIPFQFNYPTETLDWTGYFLQEELTHQLVLSRKFAPRTAQAMQLWSQKLELGHFEQIHQDHLIEIRTQQLLWGEFQKVIGYASFRGTLFWIDSSQKLQSTSFQSTFAWDTPDRVIQSLFQALSQVVPTLSEFTPLPQGYQWESLAAFYQWKLQPRKELGTIEWQNYKEELEVLLSHYPDIARLIYPALAGLLLLEGTQPTLNKELLQKAQEAIQEALHLDPKNDQNHALLAQIYYFQNDKNSAKSETVIANAQNPQNAMVQVLYGLTISPSPQERAKHILEGLERNPFLKEFPFFANRNLPTYQALQPTLADWNFPQTAPDASQEYDLALKEGQELFLKKQWPLAQAKFEQATLLKPQQLEPQLYLVRIALAQKEYQGALDALAPLKEQFPENEQVLLYLGLAHERLKSFEQAEDFYRQILFLKEDHPQALLRLGTVLIKKKQYADAQNYLETLIRTYPDYALGWWNLSLLYAQQKQWKKAESHMKEALRLNPNNSKIQKMLMWIQEKIN